MLEFKFLDVEHTHFHLKEKKDYQSLKFNKFSYLALLFLISEDNSQR